MKARIYVTLKNGVLDPQGEAIKNSVTRLGFAGIGSIRQGKVFDIEFEAATKDMASTLLQEMCESLLANMVIENYQIELVG